MNTNLPTPSGKSSNETYREGGSKSETLSIVSYGRDDDTRLLIDFNRLSPRERQLILLRKLDIPDVVGAIRSLSEVDLLTWGMKVIGGGGILTCIAGGVIALAGGVHMLVIALPIVVVGGALSGTAAIRIGGSQVSMSEFRGLVNQLQQGKGDDTSLRSDGDRYSEHRARGS